MTPPNKLTPKTWKRVDGVLLLDKPSGLTSNHALQKARRLFSAAKGGHTGTLDPLASGLLPLCFGEATKFSSDLLDADKTYEATLQLGACTDTGDAEGQITRLSPVRPSREAIDCALSAFRGDIVQTPPMYSALKQGGRPLYLLARQGIEVPRAARAIRIHALEILQFSETHLELRVACSKGTYIRVLATDLGEALGCGAHLSALRRTGVGGLKIGAAHRLDTLEAMTEEARAACLLPVDALLELLPRIDLAEEAARRFCHGNPVPGPEDKPGPWRVYVDGRLAGTGYRGTDGLLWPKRLTQDRGQGTGDRETRSDWSEK